jgi:glycosyltransferase involved in cell wall biosynthesis
MRQVYGRANAALRTGLVATGIRRLVHQSFSASAPPVVYTPHCISTMAPSFDRGRRLLFHGIELGLSQVTRRIITASREEYDHIRNLGVSESRLRLIRHGVEPLPPSAPGAIRTALGLAPDKTIVGFVGRFSEQKNPELLIRAFAGARGGRNDVRLALLGVGELEAHCRSVATELGIDDCIDWLGYRAGYASMPAFDVLAIPSRYEGLPYVMIEGISAGLPIVITEVGGVGSVVESGINGFVVPSEDVTAFQAALSALLDSPVLRQRFAEASKHKAALFSIEAMLSQTLGVYAECVRQRPGWPGAARLGPGATPRTATVRH